MATNSQPDIIAITEFWLYRKVGGCEVSIASYHLFRRDRSRHGGGVCLHVRESLSVVSTLYDDKLELVWVRVQCNRGLMLLGVHYRPPGSDPSLRLLEDTLFSVNPARDHMLLVGDFNIYLLKRVSQGTADIVGLMSGFGIHQLVTEPTRVSDTSTTLIDHVYMSSNSPNVSCRVLLPLGSSDHCCISVTLPVKPRVANIRHRRKVWLYRHTDLNAINDCLEAELPAISEDVPTDVDAAWNSFCTSYLSVMNKMIPSVHVGGKQTPHDLLKM